MIESQNSFCCFLLPEMRKFWVACCLLFAISGYSPAQTYTVLATFTGPNGVVPVNIGSLAQDAAGNLYGTTTEGGASGHGIVYKVTPGGLLTILHSFAITDGSTPYAG
jgi:uncharacterized repeat protein (TIGR03803 family)